MNKQSSLLKIFDAASVDLTSLEMEAEKNKNIIYPRNNNNSLNIGSIINDNIRNNSNNMVVSGANLTLDSLSRSTSGMTSVESGLMSRNISSCSAAPHSTVMVLTAEHSPESEYEFNRLKRDYPHVRDVNLPALSLVYDSSGTVGHGAHEKKKCSNIFEMDERGLPTVTNKGRLAYLLL